MPGKLRQVLHRSYDFARGPITLRAFYELCRRPRLRNWSPPPPPRQIAGCLRSPPPPPSLPFRFSRCPGLHCRGDFFQAASQSRLARHLRSKLGSPVPSPIRPRRIPTQGHRMRLWRSAHRGCRRLREGGGTFARRRLTGASPAVRPASRFQLDRFSRGAQGGPVPTCHPRGLARGTPRGGCRRSPRHGWLGRGAGRRQGGSPGCTPLTAPPPQRGRLPRAPSERGRQPRVRPRQVPAGGAPALAPRRPCPP